MSHKKPTLILALLLIATLTTSACGQPEYHVELITPPASEALLRVGFVSGSESGLEFTLRNISGAALYYTGGYRLYHYEDEGWQLNHVHDGSGIYYLEPEAVREYALEWADAADEQELIPDGRFMLAKQIFTDLQNPDSFDYFRFEFRVLPWYIWEFVWDWSHELPWYWDSGLPDAAILSPLSTNIVVVGEVEVSRSGISFTVENQANIYYSYPRSWYLAHYVGGRWWHVPHLDEWPFWPLNKILLPSGETEQFDIEWEDVFGELPPGRYMFIRSFTPWAEHYSERTTEYVMIEFAIR